MALCVSTGALAQSSDIIVMRKAIVGRLDGALLPDSIKPVPVPPKPGEPGYFSWTVTPWKQSGSCGSRGTETRTVQCIRTDGLVSEDADCTGNGSGVKPIASRAATITQTCGYGWRTSDWTTPAATCGTATRTRDVTCFRSDGTPAKDTKCSISSRPDARESYSDLSKCSYAWSASGWSTPATQCGPATQTRSISCTRSDGHPADADQCDPASRPSTSQDINVEIGCANYWEIGEWGSPAAACGDTFSYRSVTCVRSDGVRVPDNQCKAEKPIDREAAIDYGTCTDGRSNDHPYGWVTGSYGPPSTTCGPATSTRSVKCVGNDGVAVADSMCIVPKPESTKESHQTSGCTTAWATGPYGAAQPACGATASYRSVYCLRSDGESVSRWNCPEETRPSSSLSATDYSACSFGWAASTWSEWSATCGPATQTRAVSCQRSDGSPAEDASCDVKTRPTTTQSSYQTSGCGIEWKAGPWEAPLPSCGASTQTRSVACTRSDGQEIDAAECSRLVKPETVRGTVDHSTCSYAWVTGAFQGAIATCGTTTRTRSVQCQRSDSAIVSDESCSNAGDKPEATETTTQMSGCTFDWDPGPWGAATAACGASVHSRTVTCRRSDGTAADPSQCVKTKPATSEPTTDYSTCTYDWKVSQWGGSGGCGDTVVQRRNVTCERSEGSTVADRYCGDLKPASSQFITDYSACSYSWKVVNGPWSSTCSASATRTNSVTCLRQDGEEVDESYCTAQKPEAVNTGNYSSCTYTPSYGEYQICTPISSGSTSGMQTAPVTGCTRSDGVTVDIKQCSQQPLSKSCTITYTPTYSTTYGLCISNAAGSTEGTQYAQIESCTRSTDGASVSTSYCAQQTTSRSCVPKAGGFSCGTTMTDRTPWGVDGDGYTQIGRVSGNTHAARMADALAKCAAYGANTRKAAGVCGFNSSIYYWHTTNVRTVASGNYGTICQ